MAVKISVVFFIKQLLTFLVELMAVDSKDTRRDISLFSETRVK